MLSEQFFFQFINFNSLSAVNRSYKNVSINISNEWVHRILTRFFVVAIDHIAVLKAGKQDFHTLNDIQKNHCEENVLRLEGLPWDSKENEIRQFFAGNLIFYF